MTAPTPPSADNVAEQARSDPKHRSVGSSQRAAFPMAGSKHRLVGAWAQDQTGGQGDQIADTAG